ncbi:helicase-related protein [Micromonospora sp. WMMA1949]|uniref:helicase-related protein n=1 Tax=Micromonospora sp. WMMA1949 TaxID=3015162 RepID=UPI0022B5F60E|nr:helicase-related protein [Micromonospora sp. WMMA1949]MCZ7424811.1 helicase-related protein [Micromonospora sp. WMMA1949]
MSGFDEHYGFRDELTGRLELDLLGPAGGDEEILTDPPVTSYLTGVLFPQRDGELRVEDAAESDVDLASARLDTDERPDTGVSMANVQSPSSMGLTFVADPRGGSLEVRVAAGVYEPIDAEGRPAEAQAQVARSTEESTVRWRRRNVSVPPIALDLTRTGADRVQAVPGLEVRTLVRPADRRGFVTVTVTLVDVHVAAGPMRDPYCFFQCALTVASQGAAPAIVQQTAPALGDDQETLLAELLYRHAPSFATGHGCAAEWSDPAEPDASDRPRRVAEVRSSFVPSFDVLLSESNSRIDASGLGMYALATGGRDDVVGRLRALLSGYGEWVGELEARAAALADTAYADVAVEQARLCRTAHDRMVAGVDLLAGDAQVLRAFQLANRAMALQRARTLRMRDRTARLDLEAGRWYPFQLGFILLCLRGIADPDHEDRQVADLLWFPTGGGKTEAYLGLVAFTVFLRRLRRGGVGAGVTVLMRYTLRLLTLQQFERAATLICAMERIRQDEPDLGTEEVSIGMWVGSSATPNYLKDAETALRKLRNGDTLREENPVQLRRCPWCGISIDAVRYRVDRHGTRMVVACGDDECEFRDGLPVHLVDEAVYAYRPTLVIATVDKFAQMAWKPEPAALFNRTEAPAGTPPPELIIQDELHLISGPLGTLVGLYESAIDIACDRPKVVASTATIRRAREQGRALFDRDVHQFPPSGLDARDSWFAVQAPADRKPTRRYVGLFAPGTSQATLLVRAYAALLHHAVEIDAKDAVRDAYCTLIGYFNSLRLLAAAELQVNDDVVLRLQRLAEEGGGEPRDVETGELTSRANASEIPLLLRQLDVPYGQPDALDVVLATNMISVGVDVDRLGLMAVTGQPQTTAEYIQATSRVGRKHPGTVVMLYNAARSRDRSHYENFRAYHSALYRQVESTSVTPFSARARDRALHAALISAVRMTVTDARDNDAAGNVDMFEADLRDLADRILERVRRVAPDEVQATAEHLDEIIQRWADLADWNNGLKYRVGRGPSDPRARAEHSALLCTFEDDDLPLSFPTMNSLRDVDVETSLFPREGR